MHKIERLDSLLEYSSAQRFDCRFSPHAGFHRRGSKAASAAHGWTSKPVHTRANDMMSSLDRDIAYPYASLVAMLVMRALSVAHLFALPGIAWLIVLLFRRAQAAPSAIIRERYSPDEAK